MINIATIKKVFLILLLSIPFIGIVLFGKDLKVYHLLGAMIEVLALMLALVKKNIVIKPYMLLMLALGIYYFIWNFFNGVYQEVGLLSCIWRDYHLYTFALLFVIENLNYTVKDIELIDRWIMIIIILSVITSIIQVFFVQDFLLPDTLYRISQFDKRNTSLWAAIDDMEVGYSFIPIFAIFLRDFKKKPIYFAGIIMVGAVAWFTNTRFIMLTYLVTLYVVQSKGAENQLVKGVKYLVAVISVLFIIYQVLINIGYDFQEFWETRMTSESASTRLYAIELFQKYFPQKPVFGFGLRRTGVIAKDLIQTSQIHVGYLSHLYEYGIFGSSLLFGFWGYLALMFYKQGKIIGNHYLLIGFATFLISNITMVMYSTFHVGIILLIIHYQFNQQIIARNAI